MQGGGRWWRFGGIAKLCTDVRLYKGQHHRRRQTHLIFSEYLVLHLHIHPPSIHHPISQFSHCKSKKKLFKVFHIPFHWFGIYLIIDFFVWKHNFYIKWWGTRSHEEGRSCNMTKCREGIKKAVSRYAVRVSHSTHSPPSAVQCDGTGSCCWYLHWLHTIIDSR